MLSEEEFDDFRSFGRAVSPTPRDLLPTTNFPFDHSTQRETTEIGARIKVRDPRLQWCSLGEGRSWNGAHDRLKQWREIGAGGVLLYRRPARATRGVHDRKVELVSVSVKVEEQLIYLVDHCRDSGIRSINFVDDEDDRQVLRKRFT